MRHQTPAEPAALQPQRSIDVAEGQEVEIQVKVVPQPLQWGEGLRRCARALANESTKEDDSILEEIHQHWKRGTL